MSAVFITAALAVVCYCLWVRRDTWWSRWESAATFAIAMEGCALLLLSPWAGHELSPLLHSFLGVWNVQQLVGGLCMIIAIVANINHMLVRLVQPDLVRPLMRKHLLVPLSLGVAVMLVAFVEADYGHQPDMFASMTGDRWVSAYELAIGAISVYLGSYIGRLMLLLRHDPRARTTVALYLASFVFALAACVLVAISIWIRSYLGPAIWGCICLSVGIFAYGLARSWQAKQAWFMPQH